MSYIREKLQEHWILKITAVLLAWVLWLFIQGEQGTVTTVTVPVIWDLPVGMVVSSGFPSSVQVVVRGETHLPGYFRTGLIQWGRSGNQAYLAVAEIENLADAGSRQFMPGPAVDKLAAQAD